MIRARESSDPWARKAARILDKASLGGKVSADRVDWALAYLGEPVRGAKIPRGMALATCDQSRARAFSETAR